MKLIDKDALVAEIERRINEYNTPIDRLGSNNIRLHECKDILSFLDTLEVREVDLDRDIEKCLKQYHMLAVGKKDFAPIAKHFFELGLKAQKIQDEIKIGETEIYLEDDGGEPPYDGTQWLDLSCMEYEIPKDKFKDGDNVEIIIRKAQKGKEV